MLPTVIVQSMSASAGPKPVMTRTSAIRLAVEQQHKEKWLQDVPAEHRERWAQLIGEDVVAQQEGIRELSRTISKRMSAAAGIDLQLNVRSTNVTGIAPARPLSRAYRSGNPVRANTDGNFERINFLINQVNTSDDEVTKERAKETLSNMTRVQMSNMLAKHLKTAIEKVETAEKKNSRTRAAPVGDVEIASVLAAVEKSKLSELFGKQVEHDLPALKQVTWQ